MKKIAVLGAGFVTKPIDPDQLFATLLKWIKPVAEWKVKICHPTLYVQTKIFRVKKLAFSP